MRSTVATIASEVRRITAEKRALPDTREGDAAYNAGTEQIGFLIRQLECLPAVTLAELRIKADIAADEPDEVGLTASIVRDMRSLLPAA